MSIMGVNLRFSTQKLFADIAARPTRPSYMTSRGWNFVKKVVRGDAINSSRGAVLTWIEELLDGADPVTSVSLETLLERVGEGIDETDLNMTNDKGDGEECGSVGCSASTAGMKAPETPAPLTGTRVSANGGKNSDGHGILKPSMPVVPSAETMAMDPPAKTCGVVLPDDDICKSPL